MRVHVAGYLGRITSHQQEEEWKQIVIRCDVHVENAIEIVRQMRMEAFAQETLSKTIPAHLDDLLKRVNTTLQTFSVGDLIQIPTLQSSRRKRRAPGTTVNCTDIDHDVFL